MDDPYDIKIPPTIDFIKFVFIIVVLITCLWWNEGGPPYEWPIKLIPYSLYIYIFSCHQHIYMPKII
jgi:hypothetical protein